MSKDNREGQSGGVQGFPGILNHDPEDSLETHQFKKSWNFSILYGAVPSRIHDSCTVTERGHKYTNKENEDA